MNIEVSDDLKSNFRSWEFDHDNEESLYELASILQARHSLDREKSLEIAAHWIGYEEPVEEKVLHNS